MELTFYYNNSNVVEANGLHFYDGDFTNTASVVFRVFDDNDNIIIEEDMEHVEGTKGDYRVVIPHDVNLDKSYYRVKITANSRSVRGTWKGYLSVKRRDFDE